MIVSQPVLTSFWYRACFLMSYLSESFLSEIPEKASESFLSEVFLPKLFGPKVFDFNVHWVHTLGFYCKRALCGFG